MRKYCPVKRAPTEVELSRSGPGSQQAELPAEFELG